MDKLDLIFKIYQFVSTIEKLCNITTIVFFKSKATTRMKMIVIVNFQHTAINYKKSFFLIKDPVFKLIDAHLRFVWQNWHLIFLESEPNLEQNLYKYRKANKHDYISYS